METKYVALRRMRFPNPGQTPSSLRLEPGDVFSLDGNEGLDILTLLRCGVIRELVEAVDQTLREGDPDIGPVQPRPTQKHKLKGHTL